MTKEFLQESGQTFKTKCFNNSGDEIVIQIVHSETFQCKVDALIRSLGLSILFCSFDDLLSSVTGGWFHVVFNRDGSNMTKNYL